MVKRLQAGITARNSGFSSQQGQKFYLHHVQTGSVQWVPGALSSGVKKLECEADHSSPPNAKVKNAWGYVLPHTSS